MEQESWAANPSFGVIGISRRRWLQLLLTFPVAFRKSTARRPIWSSSFFVCVYVVWPTARVFDWLLTCVWLQSRSSSMTEALLSPSGFGCFFFWGGVEFVPQSRNHADGKARSGWRTLIFRIFFFFLFSWLCLCSSIRFNELYCLYRMNISWNVPSLFRSLSLDIPFDVDFIDLRDGQKYLAKRPSNQHPAFSFSFLCCFPIA